MSSKIIIHHSASKWGSAAVINEWHRERWGHLVPKGKPSIGYHIVILNGITNYGDSVKQQKQDIFDGLIETGRPFDADNDIEAWERGAHAYGYNRNTLGVCLIGNKAFTGKQIDSLVRIVLILMERFSISVDRILGHRELKKANTECPGFEVEGLRRFLKTLRKGL